MENLKLQTSEFEVEVFSCHLEQLKDDIDKRLNDLFQLHVPNWVIDPFEADIFEVNFDLQEIFSYLQTDLNL